ncbi:hypothetical protein [Aeoliella mucimassa]|uniref:Uncharacterized protein n=1 Tax=Aeoliella mucimassa TaxID=2527972 RepID=A0A518ANM5_9BACT|nr:hypothetical protein [Aeoliella mucimassa]QDU56301.1 hypothetical protein Pan181_25100 [Aeoliella mucimassa]
MVCRCLTAMFLGLAVVTSSGCDMFSSGPSLAAAGATSPDAKQQEESAPETTTEEMSGDTAGSLPGEAPLEETSFPNNESPEAAAKPTAEEQSGPDLSAPSPEEPPVANDRVVATPAEAKVEELTQRVVALQTEVEELKATLYSLQQSIARNEDPTVFGERALGAMAEDSDLRSNLGQMLQGKVRLINETEQNAVVYINGTPWTVLTGDSYVLAPVGTVSFLRDGETEATLKGIQEWKENSATGQFELVYRLEDTATEHSVMRKSAE